MRFTTPKPDGGAEKSRKAKLESRKDMKKRPKVYPLQWASRRLAVESVR